MCCLLLVVTIVNYFNALALLEFGVYQNVENISLIIKNINILIRWKKITEQWITESEIGACPMKKNNLNLSSLKKKKKTISSRI